MEIVSFLNFGQMKILGLEISSLQGCGSESGDFLESGSWIRVQYPDPGAIKLRQKMYLCFFGGHDIVRTTTTVFFTFN
jgi:hypothetical protein